MTNLDKLQKAIAIMNKDGGEFYAEHDELHIWPNADSFTKEEVAQLDDLGLLMNEEGGFSFFT